MLPRGVISILTHQMSMSHSCDSRMWKWMGDGEGDGDVAWGYREGGWSSVYTSTV